MRPVQQRLLHDFFFSLFVGLSRRNDINKNREGTDHRQPIADRRSVSGVPWIARAIILNWQIAGQLRLGSRLLGLVSRSHRRKRRRQ